MTTTPNRPFQVSRNGDRQAVHRNVGIGDLFFKVTTADSNGALLVAEIVHHAKGGPPRHLHRDQDEWFHVIEDKYIIEIGNERYVLVQRLPVAVGRPSRLRIWAILAALSFCPCRSSSARARALPTRSSLPSLQAASASRQALKWATGSNGLPSTKIGSGEIPSVSTGLSFSQVCSQWCARHMCESAKST